MIKEVKNDDLWSSDMFLTKDPIPYMPIDISKTNRNIIKKMRELLDNKNTTPKKDC